MTSLRQGLGTYGSVSVLFGLSLIPLAAMLGVAANYSMYSSAQSQMNLAANAAALAAVRTAQDSLVSQGATSDAAQIQAGETAGTKWFNDQLGAIPTVVIPSGGLQVTVVKTTAPLGFTSTVTYSGTLKTVLGTLTKSLAWSISGSASAQITSAYVESVVLLDDSGSMLIGATTEDIAGIEALTMCSTESANASQGMGAYSWNYTTSSSTDYYSDYTWGTPTGNTSSYTVNALPTSQAAGSACYSTFTGDQNQQAGTPLQCPYIPGLSSTYAPNFVQTSSTTSHKQVTVTAPYCSNGGGATEYVTMHDRNNNAVSVQATNVPQAPCAFACHDINNKTNDYYTLVRASTNPYNNNQKFVLRYDNVMSATEQVINSLITAQKQNGILSGQFAVGVYTFDAPTSGNTSGLTQIYPVGKPTVWKSPEADTDLTTALSDTEALSPKAVVNTGNSDFPDAITALYNLAQTNSSGSGASGDGSSASKPQKNLFIVTDGLGDYTPSSGANSGNRIITTMTTATNEAYCSLFKKLGWTVYVLYTPYLPLPNPYYLTNVASMAEPTGNSQITAALQACASSPANFHQASDAADITTSLNSMLKTAISTPARFTQ